MGLRSGICAGQSGSNIWNWKSSVAWAVYTGVCHARTSVGLLQASLRLWSGRLRRLIAGLCCLSSNFCGWHHAFRRASVKASRSSGCPASSHHCWQRVSRKFNSKVLRTSRASLSVDTMKPHHEMILYLLSSQGHAYIIRKLTHLRFSSQISTPVTANFVCKNSNCASICSFKLQNCKRIYDN